MLPRLQAAVRARFANIKSWNPWAKVALWLAASVLVSIAVQAGATLLGTGFNIWSHGGGGRGVLLAITLGVLMVMMAADRRPAADFGLVVDAQWHRRLARFFGLGVASYGGYIAICVALGACQFDTQGASAYRLSTAALEGLMGFPLAATQLIIFGGYLVSAFRTRYSRVAAVASAAALFALGHSIENPSALLHGTEAPLALGLFAVCSLLATMRIAYGSIVEPTGLLAGWLMLRRIVKKTGLVAVADPGLAEWFWPSSDPRTAPALWMFVALATAGFAWRIRRQGEERPLASNAMATSFKQFAPFSNVCMLAPLDLWVGRLISARLAVGVKYVPRLVAILSFASVNVLLSLPERLLGPLFARRRVVPPLFVLGVHRSGTTHLHNLLALDPQLVAPRAYQIMNPHGFLSTGWLLTPLLGAFSPWQRPMDSVRFHIFAPNEEEFALCGMTRVSPYWGLTFPRQVADYDRYIHPSDFTPAERRGWERAYRTFVGKLGLFGRRRAVLKNPHNTARVAALVEMFPGAKFIHLHRHPYAVYRSNLHMAREGHCVHQLHDPSPDDNYATRFLDNYRAMEEAYYRDVAWLPAGTTVEVSFEELEQNPVATVRRIYSALGLEFSAEFESRLKRYLASVADYTKNSFKPMPIEEQRKVHAKMQPLFARWGYSPPEGEVKAA